MPVKLITKTIERIIKKSVTMIGKLATTGNKMDIGMIMGKPIIISARGESRKIVCDDAKAGIASDPENIDDLSEQIIKLHSDPGLAKDLGTNGRKFVEQFFNRDKLADEYLNLIIKASQ